MKRRRYIAVMLAAIAAIGVFASLHYVATPPIADLEPYVGIAEAHYCPPGQNVSYAEAVQLLAAGDYLTARASVDAAADTVTVTVTNTMNCQIPVSLGSYTAPAAGSGSATTTFFEGTPTAIILPPGARSLSVRLPSCSAEYVLWYGDVATAIPPSGIHIPGRYLMSGAANSGQICQSLGTLSATVSAPQTATGTVSAGGGSGQPAQAPYMGGAGGNLASAGQALPGAPNSGGGAGAPTGPFIPGLPNAGIGPGWQGGMWNEFLGWIGLER